MNSNFQQQYSIDNERIDLKKYIFLILSNWYYILFSLFIAIIIVLFVNRYTMPSYSASTTIILEDNDQTDDLFSGLRYFRYWRQKENKENEMAKLKSFQMAKRTLENLDFNIEYRAYGRIKEVIKYEDSDIKVILDSNHVQTKNNLINVIILNNDEFRLVSEEGVKLDTTIKFGQKFQNEYFSFTIYRNSANFNYMKYSIVIHDLNQLANRYMAKLKVTPMSEESTILELSINGHNRGMLINYLNTLSNEYIQYGLDIKNMRAENTIQFIDDQINRILDSLNSVEQQILFFRTNNEIIDLSKKSSLAFERIQEFHKEKTLLLFKENYYNYLTEYIQRNENPNSIVSPSLVYNDEPAIMNLIDKLGELYLEKEKLAISAYNDNPGIEIINEKINSLRKQILENVRNALHTNKLNLRNITNEINQIQQTILEIPSDERALLNLQRNYDLNNKFYTFLLEKRAEAGIEKASNIPDSQVLDRARLNNIRSLGPDKEKNLLLGLIIGLVVPIFFILLVDIVNKRIKTRDDIERKTSIPILGTIGHSSNESEIPVIENPKGNLAESFRHIRTNLRYVLNEKSNSIIMVTSTISGEGKTFFATNLATIIAISGKSVALIGLDLRRPKLHKIFGINNDSGITNYLIGKAKYEELIKKTNVENLFLINSGPIPPNPSELIEAPTMKTLIEKLKKDFDYIIVDTPPVALVTDALLFGTMCDTSLFIIRQNYSKKHVLDLINNLSSRDRLPNINLIVNDIKAYQALGYSYSYGYGYEYGYGYSYENTYYSDKNK